MPPEKATHFTTTRQTELPIYGSDRLGQLRRNVNVDQLYNIGGGGEGAMERGMLMFSEVLYDSPETESEESEENFGEYIVLRNTSGLELNLENLQLYVPQGKQSYSFSSGDILGPDEYMVIAYGNATQQSDLLELDNLSSSLSSDPDVKWRWQTSLTLPDLATELRLEDLSEGEPIILDEVHLGEGGRIANNSYCDPTCQQDPFRPDVIAAQRTAFEIEENAWEPEQWESGIAAMKGAGGLLTFGIFMRELDSGEMDREYELKDHLGNVRGIVTDMKESEITGSTPGNFVADVVLLRDYYAFGMSMPAVQVPILGRRKANPNDYRYGFNGKEYDVELKGGESYNFGARMYDARLGRWMSRDPLEGLYPESSPYVYAISNPLRYIDSEGLGVNDGVKKVTNYSSKPIKLVGDGGEKGTLWDNMFTSMTAAQLVPLNNRFRNDHHGKRLDSNGFGDELILQPGERFEQYKWTDKSDETEYSLGKIMKKDKNGDWQVDRYVSIYDVDGVQLLNAGDKIDLSATDVESGVPPTVIQNTQIAVFNDSETVSANDQKYGSEKYHLKVAPSFWARLSNDGEVIVGDRKGGKIEIYSVGENSVSINR